MIVLFSTAWALTCAEVVNMERAGVPTAVIVEELEGWRTPIDEDYVGCLLANHLRPEMVKAAVQIGKRRGRRPVEISFQSQPETVGRLRLDFECGTAEIGASTDGLVHVSGQTLTRGRLDWSLSGDRLALSITDQTMGEIDEKALLPMFGKPQAVAKKERRSLPCADLQISVPPELPIAMETTRGDVRLTGLSGPLDLVNSFGKIEVVGSNKDIRVRTTSGEVYTDTGATQLEADTVNGRLVLGVGEGARAVVNSVGGDVWLWGGPLSRLSVNTVSGQINLYANFKAGAVATLISHGGDIVARVPKGRIEVSSHSGVALGLERSRIAAEDVFPSSELRSAWSGLWTSKPTRWWFGSGAVLFASQERDSVDFELSARSFSGRVDIGEATVFPGSTGELIQTMLSKKGALLACAEAQSQRGEGTGHAVISLSVKTSGEISDLSAPMRANDPRVLKDGTFSKCLVESLQGAQFRAGPAAEIRWPVWFGAPISTLSPEEQARRLNVLYGGAE